MKDASQKSWLYRHFRARGWYALLEVPVFYRGGAFESRRLITDIDVLGLRAAPGLEWELVFGDCKTLKDHSPANRAIWLRGLMDHFGASKGVIILRRKQPIESDHKLFASSFGVTLLEEDEFDSYDRALIYPEGSRSFEYRLKEYETIKALPKRFPKLRPFCEYLFELAWNEGDFLNLLRRVVGEARAVAREIDPNKREHLALILEASSVFGVGLARCVGIVFNQFLQLESPVQLDHGLKYLIWGGRSQYEFVSKLRRDMMASKGKSASESSELTLPEWERFLELVRELLEAPAQAFSIPQLLREASTGLSGSHRFLLHSQPNELTLLKYSMLTVRYFCRASQLPPDVERELVRLFITLQSDIVHSSDRSLSHPDPSNLSPAFVADQPEAARCVPKVDDTNKQIELPVAVPPNALSK